MEILYVVLIGLLFILAISDLIVGVGNDAVNFLVSAIGSKSAPFWVIMIVASSGVLIGAVFSSGMMEVARNGIFHPEYFFFSEIILIYIVVMLTDVVLLDIFNTFGMPTSTTVSLVFELLGAAVAVSILKANAHGGMSLGEYINTAKALGIITGILVSVAISFTVGTFIQYLTRMLFTFRTEVTIKRYGAIWGGIAITSIFYFLLLKGFKGTPFAEYKLADGKTYMDWVNEHISAIILFSFIIGTIILQVLNWAFKANILKIVVLAGTFALAMAFAGNDLVNFIGVPLAGYSAYTIWATEHLASGVAADNFLMTGFQGKVGTPVLFLILSGIIMVLTLWFSKKSRSVTKTSLELSRQDEGSERFGSSALSRSIVRGSIILSNSFKYIVPNAINARIAKRFEIPKPAQTTVKTEIAEFDLIRASVNLVVSSALIAMGTSLKLPLSTTYVTFMVAMGTSLADGAWGRESAVYRITGVISVIGGWFFTAFVAFTIAFIFAFIINLSLYLVFVILGITLFIIYKSKQLHEKREELSTPSTAIEDLEISDTNVFAKSTDKIIYTLQTVIKLYCNTIKGVATENLRNLKNDISDVKELNFKTKRLKDKLAKNIVKLKDNSIENGHFYVQAVDYLREIVHSINYIVEPAYEHIANNHKGFSEEQVAEITFIKDNILNMTNRIIQIMKDDEYSTIEEIIQQQAEILEFVKKARKAQIKRIKSNVVGTRNSILYLNMLAETKNLVLYTINLLKSQRDFSSSFKNKK
jgi:phosphate/sulfate permease